MSLPARPSKADVVAEFRRGQILEAARSSFVRHGVTETTVDQIARNAGVAKGTVYLSYRSKDEILRQLLLEDLATLRDRTVPIIRGEGDVEARLRRYLAAMLEFFDERRDFIDHCQLEMSPEVRRKVRASLGQLYRDQVEAWRDVLHEAVTGGHVAAGEADGAATTIVSLARGLALQRIAGWATAPIDLATADACHLLWRGLATR